MLNISSRTWLLGGWMIVLALVVTISLSMAADFSTTVLLAALVVASGVVTAMLKRGAQRRRPPQRFSTRSMYRKVGDDEFAYHRRQGLVALILILHDLQRRRPYGR